MKNFKPHDMKQHFAKGDELAKIRESMKDLPMMKRESAEGQREANFLDENIRHMTGSIGGKK